MKPTQQEIIELARQFASRYTNRHYPDTPVFTFGLDRLEMFAALLLERFGAGGGEPVAFIQVDRYGEEELLWTKDDELEGVLYGYTPLYTHPSPTDLRAEYLRGLEDAKQVALGADHMGSVNLKLMKNRISNAIEALKGKQ